MTTFEPPVEWQTIFRNAYSNKSENIPAAIKTLKIHGLAPVEIILVIKNELSLSLSEAHVLYLDSIG